MGAAGPVGVLCMMVAHSSGAASVVMTGQLVSYIPVYREREERGAGGGGGSERE